jgi:hypothetical protein
VSSAVEAAAAKKAEDGGGRRCAPSLPGGESKGGEKSSKPEGKSRGARQPLRNVAAQRNQWKHQKPWETREHARRKLWEEPDSMAAFRAAAAQQRQRQQALAQSLATSKEPPVTLASIAAASQIPVT